MRSYRRRIQRTAFGLGLAAAMGFGAVQAMATPARTTARAGNCYTLEEQWCRDRCESQGWDADCTNGICTCY